jgi:hypothetical protein
VGLAAAGAIPGSALAGGTISSCSSGPVKANSSGRWRVTANLTAAFDEDCIDVTASNVVVDVHNFTITGNGVVGSGVSGINILSGKTFVFVEGANGTIQGFDVGLQDQGNYATMEDINLEDNLTSGVWLNGVSYSQFTNATSVSTPSATNPQKYGVRVTKSYLAGAGDLVAEANRIYGVWIERSNATRLWNVFPENNSPGTNLYLGCSSTGFNPLGTSCGSGATYGSNLIYDDTADNADPLMINPTPAMYGIAVDQTEFGDTIVENDAHGAGQKDIIAVGDPTCTNNLYFLNNPGAPSPNVSPACVQNP